jgi:hypothetical protein
VIGAEASGGSEGARGERVLLEGIARLKLAYFGVTDEAPDGIWTDLWDTRAGRLRLLAMEVQFDDPRRIWPPLMISPGM